MPTTKKTTKKKTAKTAKTKATKKKVTKKVTKKKDAPLQMEDPDKFKPMVFKSKVTAASKGKTLTKMAENIRKSVDVLHERSKKRPILLFTPAMLRRHLIPYDELYFQHMVSSIGFRYPSAIEIVSPAGIGSTTWVFDFIGRLLDMGCYSIYCECEGKMMSDKRVKRLMDRDPKTAVAKINSIEFTQARTLAQLDETLRKTVEDLRSRCDSNPETKGNPIFFFADPWGALMSQGEAKGNSDWGFGVNAKKENAKDSADGSNFEHAKHAQRMSRWLPAFMEKNNCSVVFLNKQNDKIEMTRSFGFTPTPSPLKNDTRVGGHALKRVCAYRMTMLKLGDIREKGGDKSVYGYNVRAMLVKNSYGAPHRTCEFSIYTDKRADTPTFLAPALSYDDRTAAWLASNKLLGITVSDNLYTSEPLGCTAVPAEELMTSLKANQECLDFVGSRLDIEGYTSAVKHKDPEPEDEDGNQIVDGKPVDEDATPVAPESEKTEEEEAPPVVPS